MKRYIKPNTDITTVELQHIMAGSGVGNGDSVGKEYTDSDVTYSKGLDFFTEEETAEKNEYGVYSLWED